MQNYEIEKESLKTEVYRNAQPLSEFIYVSIVDSFELVNGMNV